MGKILQYPFPVIFQFGTTFWRGWIISFLSSRFILTFTCSTSLSPETHQYLSEISLVVHLLVPYVFHWFFSCFLLLPSKLQNESERDRVLEDLLDEDGILFVRVFIRRR